MKHLFRNSLLFLLIAIILYWITLMLAGTFWPSGFGINLHYKKQGIGHLRSRLKEADTSGPVDLLFIGSSHAYRSFDTRIFTKQGISSFNLGSSAQTPIQSELLLNRYLNKLKPEYVIYEVSPLGFASDGVESALDFIANSPMHIQLVNMAYKVNHLKVYNTLLYAATLKLFKSDTEVEPSLKGKDLYISGGFVESQRQGFSPSPISLPTIKEFNPKQVKAFERILKMLTEKSVRIILVQTPVTSKLYNSKEQLAANKFFETKSVFYNLNETLPLGDSCFFDSHHLNQKGVVTLDSALISLLKRNGLLNVSPTF